MRKKKSRTTNRRAVSPVIATVILVAIAITIAVAVAYWMGGIAGQYTQFEQVEIQSGYATLNDPFTTTQWVITLELKNTGTKTATLISVFVSDVPVTQYHSVGVPLNLLTSDLTDGGTTGASIDGTDGQPILSGAEATVYVYIGEAYGSLSSGTTINIKLHSAGGMDYIKLIKLT